MDYIDPAKWPAIEAFSSTDDHSIESQAAHDDASGGRVVGGGVKYPAGGFNLAGIQIPRQQHVHGEWQSTIIDQVLPACLGDEPQSVFVTTEWATNDMHIRLGRFWENLAFTTADPARGGYAILDYGYRDRISNIHSTGLPISFTSLTKNGTDKGNAGGHILDNLYLTASPRGWLVTTGGVTDIVLTRSTINNCGALGGPAALEVTGLAGWQMETLKIFSCPGKIIHSTHASFNATLLGSMIDWDGGDGIGIDLAGTMPGEQGLRMTGNDLRILATTPGDYTMVSISGVNPVRLLHGFNKYWIDPVVAAASTVNAIMLSGSSYSGASGYNDYIGFGPDQRGNADKLLGPPGAMPLLMAGLP